MKELLYFSTSDLMIQVSYKKDLNSIHYFSHRELSFGERVVVEQYLLTNVAVKTEYYKKHPAMLNYIGVNSKLVKDLNQFHLKSTMDNLKEKEQKVDDSVKHLISESMANYYFEQIGNTILEIRQIVKDADEIDSLLQAGKKLHELLQAYNVHSGKRITLDQILPCDLQSYFKQA
ncbi:MAG: hypothetical protein ACE5IY_00655 [bacterium]